MNTGFFKRFTTFTFANLLLWTSIILFGAYFIISPKFGDDFWYMEAFRGWFERQGVFYPENGGNIFAAGFPWEELKYCWKYHWLYDNMRFCNMAVAFFILFPKWVGSGIVSIFWAMAMIGCAFLGLRENRGIGPLLIMLAMLIVLLPWYDGMGSEVYQFNYVATSGMALILLLWLIHPSGSKSGYAFLILYSIIFGGWQESFSFPVLGGILASLPLLSGRMRMSWIYSGGGILLGLIWLLFSPHYNGIIQSGEMGISSSNPFYITMLLVAGEHPLFWIAALILGLAAIVKPWKIVWRRMWLSPIYRLLMVSALLSLLLGIFTKPTARVGWWADLASIILIMQCTLRIYNISTCKRSLPSDKFTLIINVIFSTVLELGGTAFVLLLLYGSCQDALRFRENMQISVDQFLSADKQTDNCNVQPYYVTEYGPLYRPISMISQGGFLLWADDVNDYYSPQAGKRFFPLFNDINHELIYGRAEGNISAFKWDSYIVAPAERIFPDVGDIEGDENRLSTEEMYSFHSMTYSLLGGLKIQDNTLCILFRSKEDKKWYVYLCPQFDWRYIPLVKSINK